MKNQERYNKVSLLVFCCAVSFRMNLRMIPGVSVCSLPKAQQRIVFLAPDRIFCYTFVEKVQPCAAK